MLLPRAQVSENEGTLGLPLNSLDLKHMPLFLLNLQTSISMSIFTTTRLLLFSAVCIISGALLSKLCVRIHEPLSAACNYTMRGLQWTNPFYYITLSSSRIWNLITSSDFDLPANETCFGLVLSVKCSLHWNQLLNLARKQYHSPMSKMGLLRRVNTYLSLEHSIFFFL